MKGKDLVVGTAYAVKDRGWGLDCGVLVKDMLHELWIDRYGNGNRPNEARPVVGPTRPAASRFSGVVACGYPVAILLHPKQADQFAKIDPSRIALTTQGKQVVDGIEFSIKFARAQAFVSTWAEEIERVSAEGKAKTEAKRREEAARSHRREVAPKLKSLMGDVSYSFTEFDDRVTVYRVDELIALLEGLK